MLQSQCPTVFPWNGHLRVMWPSPPQVFCRTAEEYAGATYCPVLRSSLRGALCLGDVEPWGPEVSGTERDVQLCGSGKR